jgi:hypothetical protein
VGGIEMVRKFFRAKKKSVNTCQQQQKKFLSTKENIFFASIFL